MNDERIAGAIRDFCSIMYDEGYSEGQSHIIAGAKKLIEGWPIDSDRPSLTEFVTILETGSNKVQQRNSGAGQ